ISPSTAVGFAVAFSLSTAAITGLNHPVASQPQQNNDKQNNQIRTYRMSFSPIHTPNEIIGASRRPSGRHNRRHAGKKNASPGLKPWAGKQKKPRKLSACGATAFVAFNSRL
ncbi:MAG: hypothetical protein KKD99_05345, partial [Proteobacteria bacterium]|nr:hypothetical protein [Pseudomonadota bacterium]